MIIRQAVMRARAAAALAVLPFLAVNMGQIPTWGLKISSFSNQARETYLQTVFGDGGFIIEMREGDAERHFRATRTGGTAAAISDFFEFEEVREALIAYASGAPVPPFLVWNRMHLTG